MFELNFKKLWASCSALAFGLLLVSAPLNGVWQDPVVISNPNIPQDEDSVPVLKVNSIGNAIAIWTDEFSETFRGETAITTAFYQQGGGWQAPVVISGFQVVCDAEPLYSDQGNPDIALNASNYAVAVWQGILNECDSTALSAGDGVILATTRSTAGIWGLPEIISNQSNTADNANVSLNEAGTALAAWRNDDNSGSFIISARFLPFGGSWGPTHNFGNFPVFSGEGKPYPFINPSGNAVITWQGQTAPGTLAIQAATYNGAWSSVSTLDTNTSDLSENPRCAMAPSGKAVAIWQNDGEIRASFFNGTVWSSFVTLDNNAALILADDGPIVVVDPFGNFTATWTDDDHIIKSSSTSTGTWSTPVTLSSPLTVNSFDPFQSQETLAVNTNGDVIAIWHRDLLDVQVTQPDDRAILSAYKPFGLPWRPEEFVAIPSDGFGDNTLNIGLADCGFAVALWQNAEDELVYAAINENLLLPTDTRALRCCQKHTSGKRCINILTWTPDDCVLFYNVYCNGVLIATVTNVGEPLQFIDPLVCRNCVYTVTAVNIYGFEGDPVEFVFN